MNKTENVQQVEDFLRGYLQGDVGQRKQMMAHTDWAVLAQLELERRASRFLSALPDELLAAVACGEVDVVNLAHNLKT